MAAWFKSLTRDYWRALILWALADATPATYDPAALDEVIAAERK